MIHWTMLKVFYFGLLSSVLPYYKVLIKMLKLLNKICNDFKNLGLYFQLFHFFKSGYRDGKFPLAPMGVLAPRSAQLRPSARLPIDVSRNFPACVSAEWPSAFKTVKSNVRIRRRKKEKTRVNSGH